jgi:hypothetical protein
VVIILLVLLIKGCRDSAREQAFKDYIRNSTELVQQSDQEGSAVFALLAKPGKQSASVTLASEVNGYRNDSQQLVDRAKSLSHPGELSSAHRHLVDALGFRRDGIAAIARALPTALGDTGQNAAIAQISANMQNFVASDVIYAERFLPDLSRSTKKEGLLDQVQLPRSRFIKDLQWLNPTVAGQRIRGGTTAGPTAPGLHGTGLGTVTVTPGGQALQQGGAAEIRATPNLAFNVQVMDQGDNNESNVTVQVTISGAGKPLVVKQQLPTINTKQTKTVAVPLAATPPKGKPVTIQVQILPVPGEKNLTNNKATFAAVFTG